VIDPRWATQQIVDAVLSADDAVVAAYMKNRNNARASSYYAIQTGVAHGGLITGTAGPIGDVRFVVTGGTSPGTRAGVAWELSEIQHEIDNVLSLDFDPHYRIEGRRIFHNGAAIAAQSGGGTVSVDVEAPNYTQTSACQAPDESRWAVTVGAMAMLVPVEGENAGPQGTWGQQFQAMLQAIAAGDIGALEAASEAVAAKAA